MYTFKIANGDLAMRGDGNITQLSGPQRIEQELACWILEPLGTDKLYPGFGSKLGDYVGSPALNDYLIEIRAEVVRVVNNYIEYQKKQIERYRSGTIGDFVNAWNDDDIIRTVNSIDVKTVADTVSVTVTLTTVAGQGVNIAQVL